MSIRLTQTGPEIMQIRAVVVEDEALTRQAIAKLLRQQDWLVSEACDAAACEALLRNSKFDVAIVDLGLPGKSGQDLIAALGATNDIAILAVTAHGDPDKRIATLEGGADDFIVKPYHSGELIARIRAVLRRRAAQTDDEFFIQNWRINLTSHIASFQSDQGNPNEQKVSLTRGEVAILALLADANGRIVSRERLSRAAARPSQEGDLRTVDTLIFRLRRKFQKIDGRSEASIVTVPSLGYRFCEPVKANRGE